MVAASASVSVRITSFSTGGGVITSIFITESP
jgi:hypothetical protein